MQATNTGHDALLRTANTMVGERTSIVRDSLNLAIPILGGSITLYILAPQLVKTSILFFISASCLVVSVLIGLALRLRMLHYIQTVTFQV